ncbi:MAG: YggT family protein [Candidatus Omnitrophota bacterium]
MFVFSNLLIALAKVLNVCLTFMYWVIIIRALISWVSPDPYNPVVQFLYKVTEPVLSPIRRILPLGSSFGIDISPVIAILAIYFLKSFLIRTLIDMSIRLKMGV